jgi:hypothetical protein
VRLHLGLVGATLEVKPFDHFDEVFTTRLDEANEFYDEITPAKVKSDPDRAMVMRQAMARMLWSKQYSALHFIDASRGVLRRHLQDRVPRAQVIS